MTWAQTWRTASGITGFTLPGMIDDPFCSAGRTISPRPARGPTGHPPQVVADLRQRDGDHLERPRCGDEHVPRRLGGEVIERLLISTATPDDVFSPSLRRTIAAKSGCVFSPLPTAVPPSGIRPSSAERCGDLVPGGRHLRGVPGELLPQRHRHRVHQVGTPRLDDVDELDSLHRQRIAESVDCRHEIIVSGLQARRDGPPTERRRSNSDRSSRGRWDAPGRR